MRDGTTQTGKLRTPAFMWAGLALVEVEGWPGYYTVQAVRLAVESAESRFEGKGYDGKRRA